MRTLPVICLMGPTASGKTEVAVGLAERFPLDVVSVDSALVYRGMDIGTAKPDAATLARAPHRLIDIRDPEDAYSAGAFVRDACDAIETIHAAGRIPLLVGGTMLYFRALTAGIADLPEACERIRAEIDAEAERDGWPALHAALADIDPAAAARISPNDRQRIQRALEVYRLSGRALSDWQALAPGGGRDYEFLKIALVPAARKELHRRINERFLMMLEQGFVAEVDRLRQRPGLHADSPSMRAVGYRQVWGCLEGRYGLAEATARSQAATRQLAKRQLTWLRRESDLIALDPIEDHVIDAISSVLARKLNQ